MNKHPLRQLYIYAAQMVGIRACVNNPDGRGGRGACYGGITRSATTSSCISRGSPGKEDLNPWGLDQAAQPLKGGQARESM